MVSRKYTVTLDSEIVQEAIKKIEPYGGKLSPLVNEFLRHFVESEKNKFGEKGNGNQHRRI